MWISPPGTQMPMMPGMLPPPMSMMCAQPVYAQQTPNPWPPPIRVPNEEPEESETEETEPTTETETLMPNPIALANQLEAAAKEIRSTHFQKLASEMSFSPEILRDFEWQFGLYNHHPKEYQIRLKAVGDKSNLLLEQCRAAGDWRALEEHLDVDPAIQRIYFSSTKDSLCWIGLTVVDFCSLLRYVSPFKRSHNLNEFLGDLRQLRDHQEQELVTMNSCLEILCEQKVV